jgi:hypothetical protein
MIFLEILGGIFVAVVVILGILFLLAKDLKPGDLP